MPVTVEVTASVPMWPLRTDDEIDQASRELLHDFTQSNDVKRSVDEFGHGLVELWVNQMPQPLVCRMVDGWTLIKSNGVYECLPDDQLLARGLPVLPPLDPTPSS